MPDLGSPATVVVPTPLGNLSAIRKRLASLTFTSRRRSPQGDDNLQDAKVFLQITEEQLDKIYEASQQANETYADEITQIEDELEEVSSLFKTVKNARGGRSKLKQTLKRLGNDAATKDVLEAARELSEKATHTSARVTSSLQTAPSSEYFVVPSDEVTAQTDLCGIGFSFKTNPTANDTRKIDHVIHLVDPRLCFDDDNMEESGTVVGLRSRKSDLSTYSFHYWGSDAYNTGESKPSSSDTRSQLSSQSRTSTGMQLGDHTAFHQCHFNVLNIQSNDSSAVSDATSNLGAGFVGRDTPLLPSAVHGSLCPSCGVSRGAEAMQANVISLQEAAVDDIRSVPEQYSSAASSSQAQGDNRAVNMQSGEGTTQQVSPLTAAGTQNVKSHSLTVSGSAMVFSPTMNFNSPGATGATNTYLGTQPAHSPPPQASAQNRHLEGGVKCMEFTGNSVVYNPTFNDESQDASGAYNQEIPAAGS